NSALRNLTLYRTKCWRHGTNALRDSGAQIGANRAAILRFGVHDVAVRRIDRRLKSVAAVLEAHAEPVVLANADATARRARTAPAIVVLQAGVHVVRAIHVRRHEIRQPGGHRADVFPREPLVPALGQPGVGATEDVLRP